MKIVNLFAYCILFSEMLLQVLKIRVNATNCSSYKDQNNCIRNKCNWIFQTKTCTSREIGISTMPTVGSNNKPTVIVADRVGSNNGETMIITSGKRTKKPKINNKN